MKKEDIVTLRRKRLAAWFEGKSIPPKDSSYFSQLISGKSSFSEAAAIRIEEEYQLPVGYLRAPDLTPELGEHPAFNQEASKQLSGGAVIIYPISKYQNFEDLPELVAVDLVDLNLFTGTGRNNLINSKHKQTPITTGLLKSLKVNPKNILCVNLNDKAMEPKLNQGTKVLTDISETTLTITGGIYTLTIDGEWMVRYLQRNLDGGVKITQESDKSAFLELTKDQMEMAHFEILGRALAKIPTNSEI